jgi:hypothetical protein
MGPDIRANRSIKTAQVVRLMKGISDYRKAYEVVRVIGSLRLGFTRISETQRLT